MPVAPLTAAEAYRAAIQDWVTADRHTKDAVRKKHISKMDFDTHRRDLMLFLWNRRIRTGELPPLVEKAS